MFGLGLIEMVLALGLLFLFFRLVLSVINAVEQKAAPRSESVGIHERTARLEEGMANMQEQLARLAEGQEFTNKLLSERKPTPVNRSAPDGS